MHAIKSAIVADPMTQDSLSQLQVALREQQVILDSAGVGIVFIKQRAIIRCNQRFAQIYGHARADDMLGHASVTLYPDPQAFYTLGKAAFTVMTLGLAYKSEVLMKRRDGTLFWSYLTGKLVNPTNTEEGSIWIIDDIDDQKTAQTQLQTVLAEQSLILDNTMVGIVFMHERKVTRCNPSFEKIFGYAPGELHGCSSRVWYLSEEEWLEAGRRCYAPLRAGLVFEGDMLLRKKDGSPLHCEVRAQAIDPSDPDKGSIWITMDITARKNAENELLQARADLEELVESRTKELSRTVLALEKTAAEQKEAEAYIQRLAHFDVLTGLPNRLLLSDRCQQVLRLSQRNQQSAALMFIDLDHFKNINDSLGHRVGDEVLIELATRLKAAVREQDTVSRLGGDEFVLLLPDTDAAGAARVADKLLATALRPFQIDQHELTAPRPSALRSTLKMVRIWTLCLNAPMPPCTAPRLTGVTVTVFSHKK